MSALTRWFNQSNRGLGDLKDKHCKGRPITDTIHAVIENHSLLTYDEIEAETTLSSATLEEIFHEDLKMKKLAFR